ncbi:MAG: PepSY-associated TM helix domain-containing protein [Maricaulis sp.]|nr:PepSY-associated TM helix domain-containing protein [Maricaulis sp.]MDG2044431.1 PepSY-associated TM helix domain-containing protein [Maricaulis sp.]
MNTKRLFRQIHYWLSLVVMVPLAIMLLAGLFLMLKKEVSWIQPPSQTGIMSDQAPALSMDDLLLRARAVPEAEIAGWEDVARIDLRPGRGMAKFLSQSDWEIQLDTATGDVLSSAYRRSDWIEALHDGSYFADWVKLFVFFPTGIMLLVMYLSGIYLFLIPRMAKPRRRRVLAAKTSKEMSP